MPTGVQFGHAGAIIERGKGRPSEKINLLREAGALIAESHDQLGKIIKSAL